jgi:hypothetical protein
MEEDVELARRNAREKQRQENFDDLQREFIGNETGRMWRFLPESAKLSALDKRRTQERESMSALMMRLLSSPAYAALYRETVDQLGEYERATDRALAKAELQADRSLQSLREGLAGASVLPDGTKVFRDAKGEVWTEDGKRIAKDKTDEIHWREGAISFEEFKARKKAADDAQAEIDALRRYQVDVLGNIRERLMDEENPAPEDQIKDMQNLMKSEMPQGTKSEMTHSTAFAASGPTGILSLAPPVTPPQLT